MPGGQDVDYDENDLRAQSDSAGNSVRQPVSMLLLMYCRARSCPVARLESRPRGGGYRISADLSCRQSGADAAGDARYKFPEGAWQQWGRFSNCPTGASTIPKIL